MTQSFVPSLFNDSLIGSDVYACLAAYLGPCPTQALASSDFIFCTEMYLFDFFQIWPGIFSYLTWAEFGIESLYRFSPNA